jgi:hypothetical protein
VLAPLLLAGCPGKKHTTGVDFDAAFLFEHNASQNSGRTVRWANLPIRVFLNNIASEEEVTRWTQVTGGAVTFVFVGGRSGSDIHLAFGSPGDNVCGETVVTFRLGSGEVIEADVVFNRAIFRDRRCVGGATVTHEIGHAIGFFGHTSDGGLMDASGLSAEITPPVADMLRALYSLAPGTVVNAARARASVERPGGVGVIRIIDRMAP